MHPEADKIMFEIYREPGFNRRYAVVYFTELDEHERDAAISASLAGEHFFDGFISERGSDAAKEIVSAFLTSLNDGAAATPAELEALLAPYLTS